MGCGASTGHYSELAYEKFKQDAEDERFFFGGARGVVLEGVNYCPQLGSHEMTT